MSIIRYYLSSFNKSDIREFVDCSELFDPFKNSRSGTLEDEAGISEDIKSMSDVIDKYLELYFSQDDIDLVKN